MDKTEQHKAQTKTYHNCGYNHCSVLNSCRVIAKSGHILNQDQFIHIVPVTNLPNREKSWKHILEQFSLVFLEPWLVSINKQTNLKRRPKGGFGSFLNWWWASFSDANDTAWLYTGQRYNLQSWSSRDIGERDVQKRIWIQMEYHFMLNLS